MGASRYPDELPVGFVVVKATLGRQKATRSIRRDTDVVHVDGHPRLWLVEEIVRAAPALRVLQVQPCHKDDFGPRHRAVCPPSVEVRFGYFRPELAWRGEEGNRSPWYQSQRQFLLGLEGEQRGLFEELVAFGVEDALITARYFCLGGEDFLPQRKVSALFGYSPRASVTSNPVNAVLLYLDPTFATGAAAASTVARMRRDIARLRPIVASAALQKEVAARLSLPRLPRLPWAELGTYEAVVMAWNDGRVRALYDKDLQACLALTVRFGLDVLGAPVYRTLEAVGQRFGFSRERARQLVDRALKALGIERNPLDGSAAGG